MSAGSLIRVRKRSVRPPLTAASRCARTLRKSLVVFERRSVTVSRTRAREAMRLRTRPVRLNLSDGPATDGGDETDSIRTDGCAAARASAAGFATAAGGAQSAKPARARHGRWTRRKGDPLLLGCGVGNLPRFPERKRILTTTYACSQE